MAVSGGRDSTALWHATARMARDLGGIEVIGLHVHHGLQPQADAWVRHLRAQAGRWAARGLPVRLQWCRLDTSPRPGDSVEAWARRERYAALAGMARGLEVGLVLLAHHRRDQAETVLLQSLRGAGPAGGAAMPRLARREGLMWARPWLEQPREAVEAYLRRHRLGYVDDPSNAIAKLARNALRLQVWPPLLAAFPQAEVALAASARRAHEAAEGLAQLAALDAPGRVTADGGLDVAGWQALSPARRANLLRHWLAGQGAAAAPDTLVRRLLAELASSHAGEWPLPGGCLRLHGGRLRVVVGSGGAPSPADGPCLTMDLRRCGRHPVPAWGGCFEVRRVERDGLPTLRLARCDLRPRRGGEQFQRTPNSPPRGLKKQFQAAGIPAWERGGPLLYAGDALLYVPALGVDARQQAEPGTSMRALRWLPDAWGKP